MAKKNRPRPVKLYAARDINHEFEFHYGLDALLKVFNNNSDMNGVEVFEVTTKSIGFYALETRPVKIKQRKSK